MKMSSKTLIDTKDKSIMNHTCMGLFQSKSKTGMDYWEECLSLYRASKLVRKIRDKYSLSDISKLTGFSKNYICGVQELRIKANEDFISKLKELSDGQGLRKAD